MLTKKDKALAAAQKFLERGQQEKALAEFAKVVQEDPKDTRTWLKMAEIYARRGATDQARDIYLRTGEIYFEQGFLQKAVAVYKNVIKLAPTLSVGHLRLGEVYQQLGLVADALHHLELGAASLQKAGRSGEALPALRQIVELHPENVSSRIRLAESASQAGAVNEAIQEFAIAAEQLQAQGRSDEYVRVAERLLFHQPDNFDVARELAMVYIARGNPRLALAKLQGPLQTAPRDVQNVEILARAMEHLDGPKAASVWRELAEIHDHAGRLSERDGALAAARSVSPNNPELIELGRRWGTPGSDSDAGQRGAVDRTPSDRPPLRSSHLPPPLPAAPPPPAAARTGGRAPPPLPPGALRQSPSPGASGLPVPGARRPSGSFSSLLTPRPDQDVARIFSEAEVFVKYGLYQRAVDHLRRIFEHQPDHRGAREKLAAVLAQLGRRAEAAVELATIAEGLVGGQPAAAQAVAERALVLDPSCGPAAALLGREAARPAADPDDDPLADEVTPPPLDVDAELEQVDFFLEQSLFDEARSLLDELRRRYRDHPRVIAQMRELERAVTARSEVPASLRSNEDPDTDIEHTLPDRLGAIPDDTAIEVHSPGIPVAVVADGETADLSTHGDLGIAYKGMGLYDAAVAEFKLLTADPAREVFALTMIGECMESKGTLTDAVMNYKEALNCPEATPTETLLLYYQLGAVFERLGDQTEALYFFEKVAKRDARFRDVDRKIATLKPHIAHV